ncbi:MAG TPA: polyprenol monophosphomannose synthase [Candidatus Binataceae bacterium]|nr:polyprenol monophosphomannose synthase [Candidatus Binataceae bacterium]
MPTPELSLVVPTYNERENIEEVLVGLTSALEGRDYEMIVVDDDSADRTWQLVEGVRAAMPNVRLERRRVKHRVLAQAILAGFDLATGKFFGCMDADGSHPPEAVPELLAELQRGFEMVVGSRYVAGGSISGWPPTRRILSRTATVLTCRALDLSIQDPMSGFFLMCREVYERATLEGNLRAYKGYKVLPELLMRGHPARVAEVPIHFRNRRLGKSKLSAQIIYHGATSVFSLMKIRRAERAQRY